MISLQETVKLNPLIKYWFFPSDLSIHQIVDCGSFFTCVSACGALSSPDDQPTFIQQYIQNKSYYRERLGRCVVLWWWPAMSLSVILYSSPYGTPQEYYRYLIFVPPSFILSNFLKLVRRGFSVLSPIFLLLLSRSMSVFPAHHCLINVFEPL